MASSRPLTGDEVRQAVFAKPSMGKRGYNAEEVDAFMARVADALDGSGSLTADEVRNVVFRKPPLGDRGYREDEVDAMLDVVTVILRQRDAPVAAQHTEPLAGYQLRQTAFSKAPLGKRGYDEQQVDEFMARAADALDGSGLPLSPEQVQDVSFEPAKGLRRGYLVEQVDAMLDRIVAELRRRTAGW